MFVHLFYFSPQAKTSSSIALNPFIHHSLNKTVSVKKFIRNIVGLSRGEFRRALDYESPLNNFNVISQLRQHAKYVNV